MRKSCRLCRGVDIKSNEELIQMRKFGMCKWCNKTIDVTNTNNRLCKTCSKYKTKEEAIEALKEEKVSYFTNKIARYLEENDNVHERDMRIELNGYRTSECYLQAMHILEEKKKIFWNRAQNLVSVI